MISVLKLTKSGCALLQDVKNESRLPLDTLVNNLENLKSQGVLKFEGDLIDVDSENRLKLAVKAISLGADVEVISSLLRWQEFESISATALRNNGYQVVQNLRFKHVTQRWEIDVVGCRKPLVVCVDCKDFHHSLTPSAMSRIVEAQVERVRALVDILPAIPLGLECVRWKMAKFLPMVLALMPSRFKFRDGVPIVPVLQLQDFLQQLPLEVESLKYFQKEVSHLSDNLQDRCSGKF